MTCRQYCHVGNTAQHCRLGLFQGSDFAGDFQDSKSTSVGISCFFGSRTFVLFLMCKKQTSVSHSSTESDIISLDVGLRMDGLLALYFWGVVIEVLRSSNSTKPPACKDNSFRDVKYAEFGIQVELTMTGQSRTTTSRRKELCIWNSVCVVK